MYTVRGIMKITNEPRQRGAARRPFGCLMYINDPRKEGVDKITRGPSMSLRAIYLGYDHQQVEGPSQIMNSTRAYVRYCPVLQRLWIGVDCTHVPDCFPGLASKPGGTNTKDQSCRVRTVAR